VIATADSHESFIRESLKALTVLFHIGTQATVAFPPTSVSPRISHDSEENGEGTPSPMMNVSGQLPLKALQGHVQETNHHLPQDKQIHIALVNGAKSTVIAGPPQSLYGLALRLRKIRANNDDESRVPYHKRGVRFIARFLPITAPFHSPYLSVAAERIANLIEKPSNAQSHDDDSDLFYPVWRGADLAIPVFATESGRSSCSTLTKIWK
jgi:fatty acid synthase subunit beta